jgi:hypothetical protein
MLCNTVGIMLFILAFTVLVSGGVTVSMRLPMERPTEAKPIYFVCFNQKVLPLDPNLDSKIIEPLGEPTYATLDDWVRKFNEARVEDEFFDVNGLGESYYVTWNSRRANLTSQYKPKPGKGDTKDQLRKSTSTFAAIMAANSGHDKFAYFLVYPDSIDVFREARSAASELYKINTGWSTQRAKEPVRFNLSGGSGVKPIPQ